MWIEQKFDQLDKRKEEGLTFKYKLNDNRGRELSISELILPQGSASLQGRYAKKILTTGSMLNDNE